MIFFTTRWSVLPALEDQPFHTAVLTDIVHLRLLVNSLSLLSFFIFLCLLFKYFRNAKQNTANLPALPVQVLLSDHRSVNQLKWDMASITAFCIRSFPPRSGAVAFTFCQLEMPWQLGQEVQVEDGGENGGQASGERRWCQWPVGLSRRSCFRRRQCRGG